MKFKKAHHSAPKTPIVKRYQIESIFGNNSGWIIVHCGE